MSKNNIDIFEGHYRYFAYPVNDITAILKTGLLIKKTELEYRITSLSFHDENLQEWLNINPNNYSKYICILKIPTHYFGFIQENGKYTPCMPLIRSYFDWLDGEVNYVIPELILGIYNNKTKEYLENPEYNPFFDPNGLQFTDGQIFVMETCRTQRMVDYAKARRNIPYWTLLKQDEDSKVLMPVIEYYNNLARVQTNKRSQYFKSPRRTLLPNPSKYSED